MNVDKYMKFIFTLIALSLVILTMNAITTKTHAGDSFSCKGKLKASPYGTTEYPGYYTVDVRCN